ncbi:MAG: hypothetical protein EXS10_01780 [Phycisphaerales bacterium]|nr:hypothetical protein [Phycisphaerales bacterium]
MSMNDTRLQLSGAHKDLLAAWMQVKESWRDDVSRAFYERSIEPIDRALHSAGNALEAMDETLRRIRAECSDHSSY